MRGTLFKCGVFVPWFDKFKTNKNLFNIVTKLLCSLLFREKLKQLIEKRIGKENFVEKLCFITKHELYSRAAQKPQPVFPSPEQMLFDHEFTKLVKELEGQSRHIHPNKNSLRELLQSFSWPNELCSSPYFSTGVITKAVHKSSEEEKKEEEVKKTLEQHDNIVTQYKELIREQVNNTIFILLHVVFVQFDIRSCWQIDFWSHDPQDAQLQELKEQVACMTSQNEQLQATITQQQSQILQHKDQYNILKLKLGGCTSSAVCVWCEFRYIKYRDLVHLKYIFS